MSDSFKLDLTSHKDCFTLLNPIWISQQLILTKYEVKSGPSYQWT